MKSKNKTPGEMRAAKRRWLNSHDAGYQKAMVVCAGLLVLGAAVSWLLIRNPLRDA